MNKSYNPPKFSDVIKLLLSLELTWEGKSYTIDEWREKALWEVENNRKQSKISIFNRFTSALQEGYGARGDQYGRRIELMNRTIRDFSDVTIEKIDEVLTKNRFYLKSRGIEIALSVKRIVEVYDFEWKHYFQEAELQYESSYKNDKFLRIRGVGSKTRDFALSEFSNCYCAIDRNIARVIWRTGLLLHGYGQSDFGTSPTENYHFLQRLLIQFSKESGWSPGSHQGYSLKEIDAMLWFFSNEQGICKNKPDCFRCPLNDICLTFQKRG
jgi:endonuclease III